MKPTKWKVGICIAVTAIGAIGYFAFVRTGLGALEPPPGQYLYIDNQGKPTVVKIASKLAGHGLQKVLSIATTPDRKLIVIAIAETNGIRVAVWNGFKKSAEVLIKNKDLGRKDDDPNFAPPPIDLSAAISKDRKQIYMYSIHGEFKARLVKFELIGGSLIRRFIVQAPEGYEPRLFLAAHGSKLILTNSDTSAQSLVLSPRDGSVLGKLGFPSDWIIAEMIDDETARLLSPILGKNDMVTGLRLATGNINDGTIKEDKTIPVPDSFSGCLLSSHNGGVIFMNSVQTLDLFSIGGHVSRLCIDCKNGKVYLLPDDYPDGIWIKE